MSDAILLQVVAGRRGTSQGRNQLQPVDWLQQALDTFVAEGIDAVRITRLAEDLGVTRGSFYWHFENREDLIDALVKYWQDKNTPAIVDAVTGAENLVDGIFAFFELCVDSDRFDPRLDLALREWARRSERIRALVDAEDEARIDALRRFYRRCDYADVDALIRARILYFSQIGFYALEVTEPLQRRLEYTGAYFEGFTGRKATARQINRFCRYISDRYGDQIR